MSAVTASGHAIVKLVDGRVYEGEARVVDRWVHGDVRLRVGSGADVSYRKLEGGRSWPMRTIREIRWQNAGSGS